MDQQTTELYRASSFPPVRFLVSCHSVDLCSTERKYQSNTFLVSGYKHTTVAIITEYFVRLEWYLPSPKLHIPASSREQLSPARK